MSGEAEYGKCDICKEDKYLQRTYFRYDIKCECHSPTHFEVVRHCNSCKPEEPNFTKLLIRTDNLHKLEE